MVESPSDSAVEGSDNLSFDDSKLQASTANTNLIQVVIFMERGTRVYLNQRLRLRGKSGVGGSFYEDVMKILEEIVEGHAKSWKGATYSSSTSSSSSLNIFKLLSKHPFKSFFFQADILHAESS